MTPSPQLSRAEVESTTVSRLSRLLEESLFLVRRRQQIKYEVTAKMS